MALCLAESLVECGAFDPTDQFERYVRWWRHSHRSSTGHCFDIGNTMQQALRRYEATRRPWCGASDPRTAGNGSTMRLIPAVLAFASSPREAVAMAAESSLTTHAAPGAVSACQYLAVLYRVAEEDRQVRTRSSGWGIGSVPTVRRCGILRMRMQMGFQRFAGRACGSDD